MKGYVDLFRGTFREGKDRWHPFRRPGGHDPPNATHLQEHTNDFAGTARWQTPLDDICPGVRDLDLLQFIGHGPTRRAWRRWLRWHWTRGWHGAEGRIQAPRFRWSRG